MDIQDTSYQTYIRSIEHYDRISVERERELSEIIHTSDDSKIVDEARNELITSNLLLVVKWANHYYSRYRNGLSRMDMVGAGNEGLMSAAEAYRYTEEHGAVFGTYASYAIKRKIVRAIQLDATIHFPLNHIPYWMKICKLEEEYGEELTDDIIVENLGISHNFLDRLKQSYKNRAISLEEVSKRNDDDSTTDWQDFIPDKKGEEHKEKKELRAFLRHYYKALDKRRQSVIEYMYFTPGIKTLEDVAVQIGVSRERVRQLHISALRKIRLRIMSDVAKGKEISIDERLIEQIKEQQKIKKSKEDLHRQMLEIAVERAMIHNKRLEERRSKYGRAYYNSND